jgi:hypothetical protein
MQFYSTKVTYCLSELKGTLYSRWTCCHTPDCCEREFRYHGETVLDSTNPDSRNGVKKKIFDGLSTVFELKGKRMRILNEEAKSNKYVEIVKNGNCGKESSLCSLS